MRQLDFQNEELAAAERDNAVEAIDDPVMARLMTAPRIDVTVAMSVVAVGDFSCFETPDQPVCYLGLDLRIKRSGNSPATHGRITKAGPAQARGILVEAALAASRTMSTPFNLRRRLGTMIGSKVPARSRAPRGRSGADLGQRHLGVGAVRELRE